MFNEYLTTSSQPLGGVAPQVGHDVAGQGVALHVEGEALAAVGHHHVLLQGGPGEQVLATPGAPAPGSGSRCGTSPGTCGLAVES